MGRLANKVAFITGAGAGIGSSAAELFAREGAKVVVAEVSVEAGQETVRRIHAAGGEALFVETDVTEIDSVQHAIGQTVASFGSLNILYNNAGGSTLRDGSVTDVSVDEFWRTIKLDLFGTVLCCKFGIPEIIRAGGGSVVNTVSTVALIGTLRHSAYAAAKGGVAALTRAMAVEYAAQKVRVNAVAPTRTLTERILRKAAADPSRAALADRLLLGYAEPIDIAYAALYLASDESRVTTGHILAADSGHTIC
jgi:NAD(P)-dependent dehydrogenase (short-subunit alcohol dehydrogenase family)